MPNQPQTSVVAGGPTGDALFAQRKCRNAERSDPDERLRRIDGIRPHQPASHRGFPAPRTAIRTSKHRPADRIHGRRASIDAQHRATRRTSQPGLTPPPVSSDLTSLRHTTTPGPSAGGRRVSIERRRADRRRADHRSPGTSTSLRVRPPGSSSRHLPSAMIVTRKARGSARRRRSPASTNDLATGNATPRRTAIGKGTK